MHESVKQCSMTNEDEYLNKISMYENWECKKKS